MKKTNEKTKLVQRKLIMTRNNTANNLKGGKSSLVQDVLQMVHQQEHVHRIV